MSTDTASTETASDESIGAGRRRIYLIDGNALAYRSYFAFIRNPLINSKGQNTSAVFGFTTALRRIAETEKPDAVLVIFDPSGPTFRHEMFSDYKATREKMPDDMRDQMPIIRDVVDAMGIPIIEMDGFEADDVIGTLTKQAEAEGVDAFVVSGDKDFMQLVSDRVRLYDPGKSGSGVEVLGPPEVEEKFGAAPDRVIDVLALMGDSSDNVPGIPGIGPKTAKKLVSEYGGLDDIYGKLDEVKPPRIQEKLREHREMAELSRKLVTIDRAVPLDDDGLDGYMQAPNPDTERLNALFRELEFRTLVESSEHTIDNDEHTYTVVSEPHDITALRQRLESADEFVFDLETTSLNAMEANIVGFAFAFREREAFYVPAQQAVADLFTKADDAARELTELFRPALENPAIAKVGQNIQYDALVLRRYGVTVRNLAFDTMVASYCIEPGFRQHNLDALALRFLNYRKIATSALIGTGAKQKSMADVPVDEVGAYACEDADITLRLKNVFSKRMDELEVTSLFESIEMPLVPVLLEMEEVGVSLDVPFLEAMSERITVDIGQVEKQVHEMAGEEFNISSPKQLGPILFEKLEIQKELGVKRLRKTKTGYATDQQTLEKFSMHPIVDKILEYRQLTKLKGTYLDALPALVNPRTGRLHTSYNQTVAATGRLSSSDPNLQNIPIRTEVGREIRKAFVPREETSVLLGADYSQIELRILAHLTGDEGLVEAFRNKEDIHTQTASLIFGVDAADVTIEMRSKSKAINFGVIYGMGPDRLSAEAKITRKEAQSFIEAYFEHFKKVRDLIDSTIEEARRNGYVTTILGRRRYLPDINSGDNRSRRAAENMAVNTPIQGSAADLIKKAMIDIHRELHDRGLGTKMILQVHDELLFEVPRQEVSEIEDIVRTRMEGSLDLRVPLVVDMRTGRSWYEAH